MMIRMGATKDQEASAMFQLVILVPGLVGAIQLLGMSVLLAVIHHTLGTLVP